jgi:MYXO-CTERM domain-containing protein
MPQLRSTMLICSSVMACITCPSHATFVVYEGDGSAWFEAVPIHSTITFSEFPHNTKIDDEYASLGVTFTDTDGNWILGTGGPNSFIEDGMGLNGNAVVELTFDGPMSAFASSFPGVAYFDFFAGEQLLFTAPSMGGSGVGFFAGFTSSLPFDRVRIYGEPPDPFGNPDKVFFDSFYFASVPSPGGIAIVALAGLGARRRRR